jgi:hypothetical protein
MESRNILASVFDWLGDALERFNPSAYKFLAAVLPYLTPIPVAWLTSKSAAEFLSLPPEVAFILVFALEGIGLWFTSLLVDSVVDWIRSRNWKTFALVILFGVVVGIYITVLVNLNVTLEAASNENSNPALSRVITLLCFLPLLTGVGNGYYKLKLDAQKRANENLSYERSQAEIVRKEKMNERLEKYRIKHERTMETNERSNERTNVRKVRTNGTTNERSSRTNGELRTFVLQIINEYEQQHNAPPGVSEVAKVVARVANEQKGIPDSVDGYERYKGYVSEVRKGWMNDHPQYLQ